MAGEKWSDSEKTIHIVPWLPPNYTQQPPLPAELQLRPAKLCWSGTLSPLPPFNNWDNMRCPLVPLCVAMCVCVKGSGEGCFKHNKKKKIDEPCLFHTEWVRVEAVELSSFSWNIVLYYISIVWVFLFNDVLSHHFRQKYSPSHLSNKWYSELF